MLFLTGKIVTDENGHLHWSLMCLSEFYFYLSSVSMAECTNRIIGGQEWSIGDTADQRSHADRCFRVFQQASVQQLTSPSVDNNILLSTISVIAVPLHHLSYSQIALFQKCFLASNFMRA